MAAHSPTEAESNKPWGEKLPGSLRLPGFKVTNLAVSVTPGWNNEASIQVAQMPEGSG